MTYYWGYYGGLRFSRNNGSELNWCIIEYVKGTDQAAISVSYEGAITLNNCTIRNNQGWGVNTRICGFFHQNAKYPHMRVVQQFSAPYLCTGIF